MKRNITYTSIASISYLALAAFDSTVNINTSAMWLIVFTGLLNLSFSLTILFLFVRAIYRFTKGKLYAVDQ